MCCVTAALIFLMGSKWFSERRIPRLRQRISERTLMSLACGLRRLTTTTQPQQLHSGTRQLLLRGTFIRFLSVAHRTVVENIAEMSILKIVHILDVENIFLMKI